MYIVYPGRCHTPALFMDVTSSKVVLKFEMETCKRKETWIWEHGTGNGSLELELCMGALNAKNSRRFDVRSTGDGLADNNARRYESGYLATS